MLNGAALDTAIKSLPSRPFRGTYFRAIAYAHAKTPLGHAPTARSNRFNVTGGAFVFYLGESHFVCSAEVQAAAFPAQATVIFPVEFDLKAVADLSNANVLKQLDLTQADVDFNFRSLGPSGRSDTQELGERCAALGCIDALLYESVALRTVSTAGAALGMTSTKALAVFKSSLSSLGSSLTVRRPKGKIWATLP